LVYLGVAVPSFFILISVIESQMWGILYQSCGRVGGKLLSWMKSRRNGYLAVKDEENEENHRKKIFFWLKR